ncbi:unnamed protein product [Symbiodinium microadriaticum]|nr:unnamed protein product [Symbiodinium sp. KB8]CAE7689667.1 unnamed protein product [Symbiodinium microadriaticum]
MALIASWHRERDVISECFVIGSPNVGPGTYDPRLPAAKTCTLGIGDRPNPSRDASDLPGPGQYAVRRLATDPVPDRPSQSLTASCSSFNSTTSRCDPENVREPTFVPGSNWFVASSILDNPGPGQSNPRDAVDRRPKTGGVYERSRPGKADWGAERAVQAVKEGTRLHTQTEPAIKPLRDRSDWNFTGEPGDTPDPYSSFAAPPSFESRAFAHVKHRRRISLNNGSSICKSDGPAGRRVSLVPSSARTSCAKRF